MKLFESKKTKRLTEGVWSDMMKGVKSSQAPFTLVAIADDFSNGNPRNSKVIGQKIDIKIPDSIPAQYEAMKKEYPKARLIVIEDSTGKRVWDDSSQRKHGILK